MSVPCMILYGLNPLAKADSYNTQFILLYNLPQLNILGVDRSLGAWFYHRLLSMPTQVGHGLK